MKLIYFFATKRVFLIIITITSHCVSTKHFHIHTYTCLLYTSCYPVLLYIDGGHLAKQYKDLGFLRQFCMSLLDYNARPLELYISHIWKLSLVPISLYPYFNLCSPAHFLNLKLSNKISRVLHLRFDFYRKDDYNVQT